MRRLFKDEAVRFKKLTQWDQEAFFTDSIVGLGDNELQSPDDLLEMAQGLPEDDDETLDKLFHIIEYLNDAVYVMQDIDTNMYYYCTRIGIRLVKLNCEKHPEEITFSLSDRENGDTVIEFDGGMGKHTYILRGTLIAKDIPLDTNIDDGGKGLACGIQMDATDIMNLYNAKAAPKVELMMTTAAYAEVEYTKFKGIEDVLMEQATKLGKSELMYNPEAYENLFKDLGKDFPNNDKEDK